MAYAVEVADIGIAQDNSKSEQDRYQIIYSSKNGSSPSFFAVFDGHNHSGAQASSYAANHLHKKIFSKLSKGGDLDRLVELAYLETDQELCSVTDSGTTAVVALVDSKNSSFHISNVGDARAVFFKDGKATQLSEDHIPKGSEKKRVLEAGGRVLNQRIDGRLAVSRSLGDIHMKWGPRKPGVGLMDGYDAEGMDLTQHIVSPFPYVASETFSEKGLQFLILASDGVLGKDSLGNQEASKLVQSSLSQNNSAQIAAEVLVEAARTRRQTKDDLTAMIVVFGNTPLDHSWEEQVYSEPTHGEFFDEVSLSYEGYLKNVSRKKLFGKEYYKKEESATRCCVIL